MGSDSIVSQESNERRVIACKGCGLESSVPILESNQTAYCSRCGHKLTTLKHNWVDKVLALGLSGLVLLILSLFFNFLSFSTNGLNASISLISEVETLIEQGYVGLAGIILFACLLLPAGVLLLLSAWMIMIKFGIGLRATKAQISLGYMH